VDRACQKGGPCPCQRGHSATMVIMRVLVEELLHQDSRCSSLVFENLPSSSMWVRSFLPSCPALKGVASQKLGDRGACAAPRGPSAMRWGPCGMTRWQDFVHFILMGNARYGLLLSLVLFRRVAPPL
jgi:hypothetical protein